VLHIEYSILFHSRKTRSHANFTATEDLIVLYSSDLEKNQSLILLVTCRQIYNIDNAYTI